MQRVLVTGGAGFIGSQLVRTLLAQPGEAIEVLTYDALTYAGLPDSLSSLAAEGYDATRHQLVQADITDAAAFGRALASFQPDTLLHLAAESHVDRSIETPDLFLQTNVLGTSVLLKGWLAYRDQLPAEKADLLRLVHVSTDEVYGSLEAPHQASEGDRYHPSSPYSASKAAADHLVQAYTKTYGLSAVLTHATNTYGPRQFPEKLIPVVLQRALAGESIPIYGSGTQVRDWLHVEDHCRALVKVAKQGRDGEAYHIGANDEQTNLELVGLLCDMVDQQTSPSQPSRSHITHVNDRPGHDARYALSTEKIRQELGWKAETDLAEGLRNTVQWYLENQAWTTAALERSARCE